MDSIFSEKRSLVKKHQSSSGIRQELRLWKDTDVMGLRSSVTAVTFPVSQQDFGLPGMVTFKFVWPLSKPPPAGPLLQWLKGKVLSKCT